MQKILKLIFFYGIDGLVVGIVKGKLVIIVLFDEYGVKREERVVVVYLEVLMEWLYRVYGG